MAGVDGTVGGRLVGLRVRRLAHVTGSFLGGVAIPVLLFCLPFLLTGSLAALLEGTPILPFRRLSFAAAAPLPLSLAIPAVPVAVFAVLAAASRRIRRSAAMWILVALLASVLMLGGRDAPYLWSWAALLLTLSVAVLAGLWAAARQWLRGGTDPRLTKGAAVVAMLTTFTLVQYPFSGPVYFFYVAPLVVLTSLVAVSLGGRSWSV